MKEQDLCSLFVCFEIIFIHLFISIAIIQAVCMLQDKNKRK